MTPVYHITHIENLPRVAASGAIWCDRCVRESAVATRSIAYGHIKARREGIVVPLPPGGTLADYVPFYFCPRAPMLYAIYRGQVPGIEGGQPRIAHLELDADALIAAGLSCLHTDGNAASQPRRFFASAAGFHGLSWDVIRAGSWHDTPEDNDRKRRKQAEFLVLDSVLWSFVRRIGVMDAAVAAIVHDMLAGLAHRPVVDIRPDWYYP
jgi:hypothetical protein